MKRILIICIALFAVSQHGKSQLLDRSQRPRPGLASEIRLPEPVKFKLANGMTVLVIKNHKLPKVSVGFHIDGGPTLEGKKAGVMRLMGSMLSEGTMAQPKAQFDSAVDELGAEINLNASGGNISALTRYFNAAFYLMAEALRSPAFTSVSFEKLKDQALIGIKSNERNSKVVSDRVVNALMYGVNHQLGEFESVETINSITLDDVKQAYQSYITPSRSYLTFAGDISPAEAKKIVMQAFGDWQGPTLKLPALAEVKNPSATEIAVINLPAAVQSEITVARLVHLPLNSPDYHAVMLANQLLGGGPEGKLFKTLRERYGFTYGAGSKVSGGRFQTLFTTNAAVRNEKVDSAVVAFLNELELMGNIQIDEESLQNAKNMYNGSFALGLEDPGRTLSMASNVLINELPRNFYNTYLKKINEVTVADILRVSKKYFDSRSVRVFIVGKQSVFAEKIKRLDYPVRFFDNFAVPLNL